MKNNNIFYSKFKKIKNIKNYCGKIINTYVFVGKITRNLLFLLGLKYPIYKKSNFQDKGTNM